ncbi:CBS domain-containing protein [Halogeometricum borinquense]|uniref:CBS-domain-containing membrane protein n=2 Tax=Halogeometricum borinquense (strain ATCC 700274 / DSM 11551 / JCM 10706 / KCTC 4070 / PR3) TaxID=469382 RepID=E4NU81_HALBP|nr:CBS domain-containing protein [Halogeometricum borinquense]ADQ68601.1 CBS-domain-containing membrane protein [Halogeometricum borinquense DSM 11551]
MTVSDLMRKNVVTATPDTAASELAQQMRDENVGSVVVEADNRPAGIVTDRDLAVGPFAESADPETVTAEDVMTSDLTTVTTDTGVMELCDELCEASVRRMPVVDGDGTLAGIVTLDDLHVLFAREQQNLTDVIEAESPPY